MDKKLAVAMFGQKRLSREGGVEIVVKELCTRMARDGYEVTCFNRGGHHVSGAEYDQAVEYKGVRQKTVPTIDAKGLAAVSSSGFAALWKIRRGSYSRRRSCLLRLAAETAGKESGGDNPWH